MSVTENNRLRIVAPLEADRNQGTDRTCPTNCCRWAAVD